MPKGIKRSPPSLIRFPKGAIVEILVRSDLKATFSYFEYWPDRSTCGRSYFSRKVDTSSSRRFFGGLGGCTVFGTGQGRVGIAILGGTLACAIFCLRYLPPPLLFASAIGAGTGHALADMAFFSGAGERKNGLVSGLGEGGKISWGRGAVLANAV